MASEDILSEYKISGCCSTCDTPVFEVEARYAEHERRPGEPKRLGKVSDDDAMRVTFLLFDGAKSDLTFCGRCINELSAEQYIELWRKVMRTWLREQEGKDYSTWMPQQFHNGLLIELGRIKLREALNGTTTTS